MESQQDTSFIEDLPKGPLDHYRAQATFDWKKMKVLIEDPEIIKLKMEIWETLRKDPLFQLGDENTDQLKRKTQLQVKKFLKYKFLRNLENLSYTDKTKTMMTVNEALITNPSLSVKLGLGFSLFSNTLFSMGTETHQAVYKAALEGKIFAAIALTEVAHGSNTRDMQTTATYDPSSEEFVINSPSFESSKFCVGNLGKTCTVALLAAQLYAEGECKGLHIFVVPVRDPRTLLPYPGIVVGDCGEKAGLHGIDNGFIMFRGYRVPRHCLLNRTASVAADGAYETSFSDPGRVLAATLEMLSAARVGIMQESAAHLANAVTIAVRYGALRRQFGPRGRETPLLEYPLHQWRLFPYVAAAVVFKLFNAQLTDVYLGTVQRAASVPAAPVERLGEAVAEIHAVVSCAKPVITWTCRDALQECREACGALGFLRAARLSDMRCDQDPAVTYEGDNNVLGQQTSNWLLRQWRRATQLAEPPQAPLGSCAFFSDALAVLGRRCAARHPADVRSERFLLDSYQWLLCWLAAETQALCDLEQRAADGAPDAAGATARARNHSQVFRARDLTRAFFEYLALRAFFDEVRRKRPGAAERAALLRLGLLYGLWSLDRHLAHLYEGGYCAGAEPSRCVRRAVLDLCAELRADAVAVVDSVALPDHVLGSMLAASDGRLYENVQRELFQRGENLARPAWWRDIVDPDAPDMLQLLSAKL